MIPAAFWLIALPFGAAPVVYFFRRVGVGAIVAAVVALFSAWLALRLPVGLGWRILGRPAELGPLSQISLVLLFTTTALLFLISSATVPFIAGVRKKVIDADVLTGAGRTFYPLSLGSLGFLVAASLAQHLGITAILVGMAGIFAVFIIQGSRLESIRAAQRFLILISLSLPLFLLVSWRIDVYQLSGLRPLPRSLQETALLAGIGFALWLAVVPFHGWVTATTAEASPISATFILVVFPIVAFLTLSQMLIKTPWLVQSSQLVWGMVLAGLVTASLGGFLTAFQRGFSGLMGYSALYDLGCTLIIFGLGGPTAILMGFAALTMRALALTLITASVSALRLQGTADDAFAQMAGAARPMPLAAAGLLGGGLTLAGAPLTIGFVLRWHLLQNLAGFEASGAILLALAGLGVVIGYLRGFRALLPTPADKRPGPPFQEPLLIAVFIVVLGGVCLVLGLFPDMLLAPLRELIGGMSLPI